MKGSSFSNPVLIEPIPARLRLQDSTLHQELDATSVPALPPARSLFSTLQPFP
jgi:hypothetical protein